MISRGTKLAFVHCFSENPNVPLITADLEGKYISTDVRDMSSPHSSIVGPAGHNLRRRLQRIEKSTMGR